MPTRDPRSFLLEQVIQRNVARFDTIDHPAHGCLIGILGIEVVDHGEQNRFEAIVPWIE